MNKEIKSVSKPSKRDDMIKYAYGHFYKNGFHATGVDSLTAGTGISKRTLYKHFTSKEGLIIATIEYYHQMRYSAITEFLEQSTITNPVDKALEIFDFLSKLVDTGMLDGCFAMNAKTEYANKAKEIEAAYDNYVAALQQMIEFYLKKGNVTDSKSVSMQVIMLFEGAIIRSKATRNSQPVKLAKAAAKLICNQ